MNKAKIYFALKSTLKWTLIVATAIVVLAACFGRPSAERLSEDAQQNLAMAYNLRHYGSFSMDTDRAPEALRPSRFREPLPVLVLSGYMLAADPFLHDQPYNTLIEGNNARILKYSNVLWSMLLVAAMILSARKLNLPAWAAALAILLAYIRLDNWHDKLYTEVAAAALIALCSYLALLAIQERRLRHFFATGLSFGLLALTKASFLYVAIAVVAIYIAAALIKAPDRVHRRFAFKSATLAFLGTLLVIAPWMLRNQMQFGSPKLADRGGAVLMERAVKNGMTHEEYIGSFYPYAPRILEKPVAALLGLKPEDRLPGGWLERVERYPARKGTAQAVLEGRVDDIVSFHYRVAAMAVAKRMAFEAAGHPNPYGAADEALQEEAVAMIKAHPKDHIVMMLPFIWRGAPFMLPFLTFVLIYAWRRGDAPLVAYVLPSLGLIGFYATFSHFIPRYAEPNAPVVAICFVVLLYRWLERRKIRHAAP